MLGKTNWLKKIYELEEEKRKISKQLKDAWTVVDAEKILQDGEYKLYIKKEPVRKIDAEKFREWFGPKIFNAVAKVNVGDAINQVGEVTLETGNDTAHFIEYEERVTKKVIKE